MWIKNMLNSYTLNSQAVKYLKWTSKRDQAAPRRKILQNLNFTFFVVAWIEKSFRSHFAYESISTRQTLTNMHNFLWEMAVFCLAFALTLGLILMSQHVKARIIALRILMFIFFARLSSFPWSLSSKQWKMSNNKSFQQLKTSRHVYNCDERHCLNAVWFKGTWSAADYAKMSDFKISYYLENVNAYCLHPSNAELTKIWRSPDGR